MQFAQEARGALYRADGGPRWSTCREWERALGAVSPCPRGRGEHGELLGGVVQAGEAVDGRGRQWRSAMAHARTDASEVHGWVSLATISLDQRVRCGAGRRQGTALGELGGYGVSSTVETWRRGYRAPAPW